MKGIARWMEQWNMWPPAGGKLLCAVSGGRDSMAMLHLLLPQACQRKVQLGVAHFHHGIRAAADRDADFVAGQCRQLGLPCFTGRGDAPRSAGQEGWTLEEAARNLRYAFLEETARSWGAERIALAHHADDSAETLLLNLLRGSGLRGLGGIAPVRGPFVRPLLCLTRQEIEEYVSREGIPFVEDETNGDESLRRNYLRHQVLPRLKQQQPRAAEHMARTALYLRQDEELLQALARQRLEQLRREEGELSLPAEDFYTAPRPLQLRMLQQLLQQLGVGEKDISARHMEAVLALRCGSALVLPRGIRVRRQPDRLRLSLQPEAAEECLLQPEQWCSWGPWQLLLTGWEPQEPAAAELCRSCLEQAVSVTAWAGADRLFLPEDRGSRSVKRLLQDRGIDPALREGFPLLRINGRAAALPTVGTDRDFLPPPGERPCYLLLKRK